MNMGDQRYRLIKQLPSHGTSGPSLGPVKKIMSPGLLSKSTFPQVNYENENKLYSPYNSVPFNLVLHEPGTGTPTVSHQECLSQFFHAKLGLSYKSAAVSPDSNCRNLL